MKTIFRFAVSVCVVCTAAAAAFAQYEGELTAKRRLFPDVGVGLRAVRRAPADRLLVLTAQGVALFDDQQHKLLFIGPPSSNAVPAAASFAEDCDVDSSGLIYVADRAANLITVYSRDGARLRSFPVNAPLSVAALPDGELAVATLRDSHLVTVFDKNGREIRAFGEFEDISSRADMNRYLNTGYLASDARGNLYYAFIYTPEPTVRQYDRNGFALQSIEFTEIEAFAAAQAARKEIERQEKRGKQPTFKPILTAIGVVPETGEVWVALHNQLLRFDKEGNRKATYQLYTPEGTSLEVRTILVQKNRILIGSDSLGIFEFERPDTKLSSTQ
jgi:hypothetical protein